MTFDERVLVARLRAAGCVFAEDEAALLLASAGGDELDVMVERRIAGEPLETVVGWVEFCGLRIALAPRVFVPRPRTELLAGAAVAAAREAGVVVDLCCGSGAIAAVVHERVPQVEVHAAELDASAAACARVNLEPRGVPVHVGDLFDALPSELRGRVEVLVANVPYVPSGDIATLPSEAREHEPLLALDGGGDGLDVWRRVVGGARTWLAPGGVVMCETSIAQAPVARGVLDGAGYDSTARVDDELEVAVVSGALPRSS